MSILSITAVALLLAAEPTAVPPDALAAPIPPASASPDLSSPPVATAAAFAPPAAADPTDRQVRAGLGMSVTDADSGFASTVQAGVQVDPWDHFGFRAGMGMTSSVVGAGGWDAAEFTGAALFRPLGNKRRVVPYGGLGVQLALLAIFPDSAPPPLQGLPRMGTGHLAPTLMAAAGGAGRTTDGFGGTNQFKVMPELTAGALVRLTPRLALDVAARYLPLFWNGTTYNGLSVVASVCTPF